MDERKEIPITKDGRVLTTEEARREIEEIINVKFTPGPWVAFYKPKYNEWHVSLPADCGMTLALFPDGIHTANPEGDANLIAAAPEMYAELNDCHSVIFDLLAAIFNYDTVPDTIIATAQDELDKIRELMKKARGKNEQ